MGITLGGCEVFVAEQHLDGPYVNTSFQQVGCKACPKGMAEYAFCDACVACCLHYNTLGLPSCDMRAMSVKNIGICGAFSPFQVRSKPAGELAGEDDCPVFLAFS